MGKRGKGIRREERERKREERERGWEKEDGEGSRGRKRLILLGKEKLRKRIFYQILKFGGSSSPAP